jgi:hypothetical protein
MESDREMIHTIEAYAVDGPMQNLVRDLLHGILKARDCDDLTLPLFTCINELLVNAVKANYKNIFFENYKPRNLSRGLLSFNKALEIFKFEIGSEGADQFKRIAQEKNLKATLVINIKNDLMIVNVTNPTPMTERERRNVAERLKALEHIQQMSDFFNINDEDEGAEGAGLGIIFVGMVLRSMGLPAGSLSIHSDGYSTTSTFSAPINKATLERYRNFVRR